MKTLITCLCLLGIVLGCSAQITAHQPKIMVIPSDALMNKLGYLSRIENHGVTDYVPDYRRALVENTDLKNAISKIGELFSDRGFDLYDLEKELQDIQQESVEDMALESRNGMGVESSLFDMVMNRVRPDIILELTYEIKSENALTRKIIFDIQAKDAFTKKQVGAASGIGPATTETLLVSLLTEAIFTHIGNLQSQMQQHFDDISKNGRLIYVRVQTFSDADVTMEDEFDDTELGEIIMNWVKKNSVNYAARITKNTANEVRMEARIPLYDDEGIPMSANEFAQQLSRYLKNSYGVRTRNATQGLGDARLVIREVK